MQSNSTTEWIAAIAAAISALGSLVAILIAKRALKDSKTSADAAKLSADASKRSADATEQSVNVARESAEASKRSADATVESVKVAKDSVEVSKRSAEVAVESLAVARESVEVSKKSVEVSERSAVAAEEAVKLTRDLFKKQSATELHNAINDVGIIDKTNPDSHIVSKAVNAMDLIATHWDFGITDKNIMANSYWDLYRGWYDALNSINHVIAPFEKTGTALLTHDLRKVYEEMSEFVKNKNEFPSSIEENKQ